MPHATVNGVRLYYEEQGSGTPILGIHGGGSSEARGGEATDNARLGELRVPTFVVTAEDSPEPIRRGSEALERALPHARKARVGGDHAIDPAGPDVLSFVSELVDS